LAKLSGCSECTGARRSLSACRKALKAAARTGRRDSEVIEETLRRDLGLELLERIWARADLGVESRGRGAAQDPPRLVRALLDVDVLISGLLGRTGAPALLFGKWLEASSNSS
jgi:hypothetical protein